MAPATLVAVPWGAFVSVPFLTIIGNQELGAVPHDEFELSPVVRFVTRLRSTVR